MVLQKQKLLYGIIGVKVWIFKGEIFTDKEQPPEQTIEEKKEVKEIHEKKRVKSKQA